MTDSLSQCLDKQLISDLSERGKKGPDIVNNPIISQLSSPPKKSKAKEAPFHKCK